MIKTKMESDTAKIVGMSNMKSKKKLKTKLKSGPYSEFGVQTPSSLKWVVFGFCVVIVLGAWLSIYLKIGIK